MHPKKIVYIRMLSQIFFFIFLVLFVVGTICAFTLGDKQVFTCTVGMLQITIGSQTLIWSVIISGLSLIVLTIILGRVFCSWVCPFGSLLDFFQGLLKKVQKKKRVAHVNQLNTKNIFERRQNKYGVLAGIMIAAGIVKSPVFCTVCPIGGTCRAAGIQQARFGLETAIIPLIAGLEVFKKRFWCRYLCPVGALVALTDRVSFLKIKLPADTCINCGRCNEVCSMDVNPLSSTRNALKKDALVLEELMANGTPDILDRPVPYEALSDEVKNKLSSVRNNYAVAKGECTRCYECVSACPVLNCGNNNIATPSDKSVPA
ncbi:polyferredoxin [Desulfitispora alkaliphila]|uniref:4Fe-4S binding protein n=1 Tax=Desulfitispora alkaliphila TaxID=622674 RepID=UPI003D1DE781